MRTTTQLLAIGLMAGALTTLSVHAQVLISTPNLLTGTTVQPSTSNVGPNLPADFIDGQASPTYVYTEGATDPNPRVFFSGFSSAISTVRFFDGDLNGVGGGRAASTVTIWYSASANDPANNPFGQLDGSYTQLGTFTLPVDPTNSFYTGGVSNDGYTYAELDNLTIPVGTQTLYLQFAPVVDDPVNAPAGYGPGFSEIQAFAPVPEPATWALMLIGGAFVAFRKVRRLA